MLRNLEKKIGYIYGKKKAQNRLFLQGTLVGLEYPGKISVLCVLPSFNTFSPFDGLAGVQPSLDAKCKKTYSK